MGRKAEDLTSSTYTYLTVLERANNIGRYVAWKCKCKCGKEIVVRAKDLKSGNTKSCGCYKIEKIKEVNTVDVSNMKFGLLTAIKDLDKRTSQGKIIVLCKCDCGNYVEVDKQSLTTGNTKSCGCSKSIVESQIAKMLMDNKILFKREYSLKGFFYKNKSIPRFDFAIFNEDGSLSHLIEYDGIQHFIATGYGWNTEENLIKIQEHDREKDEYCISNNIRLTRIKYDEGITIDKLL